MQQISHLIDAGIADYERLTQKWANSRDEILQPFTKEKNIEKWNQIISFSLCHKEIGLDYSKS